MQGATLEDDIRLNYGVSLPFYRGNFEEAKREAQQQARLLIVYLHCYTHEYAEQFVCDVLCSATMMQLLEDRALLYGATVSDLEGHRLASALRATRFPFVTVFLKQMQILTLQGPVDTGRLDAELKTMHSNWDGVIAEEVGFRMDREERQRAQHALEVASQTTEAIDRERLRKFEEEERERALEVERKRRADQEAAEAQRRALEEAKAAEERRLKEQADHAARVEALRAVAQSRLPAEPGVANEATASSIVATVAVRSLQGNATERRFLRSAPLSALYDLAMTLPDYDGTPFEVVTGFPLQVVPNTADQTVETLLGAVARVTVRLRRI